MRLAYVRATLVLGVSKGVSDDLIANFGSTSDRTLTINNPYNIDEIVSDGRKPPSIALPGDFIVAVGRLVAAKGFSDLIAAYADGPREVPLLILGDGPERAALEAQVAREKLSGTVIMPGFVRDPFAVMSRARALVSASYNEGFPNAIAEAMALGVPVLATDCPSGPAELLQGAAGMAGSASEGKCGLLVRPGDVAGLMNGIAMLCDPVTRARLAEAGRRRIEGFRVERIAEEYWRVFDAYAARGPRAHSP
jgi:glycosyltransferase involved in cell wall biosynthesis